MEIAVIINDIARKGFAATHGLSLYIVYDDRYLLFGTGPSPRILRRNAEALGVDLEMLDAAIISHEHIAHSGGVLALPPYTTIYVPKDYPPPLIHKYIGHGYRVVVVEEKTAIDTGISVSRPYYGPPNEIVLVIERDRDIFVFMGCGHAGAVNIINDIRQSYGAESIYLFGGLHLAGAPARIVTSVIERISDAIRGVAPLHCSGRAHEYLAEHYPDKLISVAGGDRISI